MNRAQNLWLLAGASVLMSVWFGWRADQCYGDGCIGIGTIAIGSFGLTLVLLIVALIATFVGRRHG